MLAGCTIVPIGQGMTHYYLLFLFKMIKSDEIIQYLDQQNESITGWVVNGHLPTSKRIGLQYFKPVSKDNNLFLLQVGTSTVFV